MASAGLYALKHNVKRLLSDHEKAKELFESLSSRFGSDSVRCATNMIHLDIDKDIYSSLASHLEEDGIKVGKPRWVLHKDISKSEITKIKRSVKSFKSK